MKLPKKVQRLIDAHLNLIPSTEYPDELGLRYLCLVHMAEVHVDEPNPAKFRSLVKRRIRGASYDQYLSELGYRRTRDRHGKCYERRFTISFTDAGMHDNSL